VRRVKEGNLIQLMDGSMVRYLGVATPHPGESHFQESLSANKRLVEDKEVYFRYGLQERSADGVWQAYVFENGFFINEELVGLGMAVVDPIPNEEKYLPDLLEAEKSAREARRGLWKDVQIDDYSTRSDKKAGFPWATTDEQKRGVKQ